MNRTILRLALPNILSNISVPLLGMVDTAIMGRLDSAYYLGAIALGSVMFNFIYWGFGFLRMGTTGLTAQAYGRQDVAACTHTFSRALLVAAGGGTLLILLQWPLAEVGFWLLEGDQEVTQLAREYFFIRIWAAPASLGLYAFHGWFLGMQNARYPMVLTLWVNLANILFNLWLVLGLGMRSDGLALGTVLAQYAGLVAAIGLFALRYQPYLLHRSWQAIWDATALREFFSVNSDIFVRTICLVFAFGFFTSKSASIDPLTLAANQILLQYFHLMAYGVDGFAYAAESLVGRFLGANDRARLKEAIRWLFRWGVGLGLVFAALYLLAGEPLLRLFTDQVPVIQTAQPYLGWMSLISVLGAIAFIWDGIYIGATATRPMRNTMLLATLGVFLPVFYLVFPSWQNHGLWLAMTVFMGVRSLFLGGLAARSIYGKLNP